MGVFLLAFNDSCISASLPHACGGVSLVTVAPLSWSSSSPRLWGCFLLEASPRRSAAVFPTPVGVFLISLSDALQAQRLPHACGGVSYQETIREVMVWSSPRLWGCFQIAYAAPCRSTVFPTPVGVFLTVQGTPKLDAGLPHACGGVSNHRTTDQGTLPSSPRLWGCFRLPQGFPRQTCVFPTPVGVFPTMRCPHALPTSLPHACGGVSQGNRRPWPNSGSSPRLWGCFRFISRRRMEWRVFPTLPYFLKMNSLRMVLVVARDRFCGRRGSLTLKAKLS